MWKVETLEDAKNLFEEQLKRVNKDYVDNNFVRKNSDTVMSAKLTAESNTAYTIKQVRNIVFWTSGETPPATSYGDVVIKTF